MADTIVPEGMVHKIRLVEIDALRSRRRLIHRSRTKMEIECPSYLARSSSERHEETEAGQSKEEGPFIGSVEMFDPKQV